MHDAFAPSPRSFSACCACLRCRAPTKRGRCASSTLQLPPRRRRRRALRSSTRRAPRCAGSRCSSSPPAKASSREAPGASNPREASEVQAGRPRGVEPSRPAHALTRAAVSRGPRRLCALGVSIEVTASGRTRALLLNDVLVGRGLAAPPRTRAPAAEPSLRRFASMAAALPPTPPATPVGRTLRRTRSGELLLHATHRADAPPQRRLRSAMQISEGMRPVSPLFSFRCPITHASVRTVQQCASPHSRTGPRASAGADGRSGGGCRWPFVRCGSPQCLLLRSIRFRSDNDVLWRRAVGDRALAPAQPAVAVHQCAHGAHAGAPQSLAACRNRRVACLCRGVSRHRRSRGLSAMRAAMPRVIDGSR